MRTLSEVLWNKPVEGDKPMTKKSHDVCRAPVFSGVGQIGTFDDGIFCAYIFAIVILYVYAQFVPSALCLYKKYRFVASHLEWGNDDPNIKL